VATDDLSIPLGQDRTPKQRRMLPIAAPVAVAGLLGLLVAVFAGWTVVVDDPFGGEPIAVVPTSPTPAQYRPPA
jgi:hypothetical protein